MFRGPLGILWDDFRYISNHFDPNSHQNGWEYYQSEGSEWIIQVPRCDDRGLGHDKSIVSVVVVVVAARPGADVSKVCIDNLDIIDQKLNA